MSPLNIDMTDPSVTCLVGSGRGSKNRPKQTFAQDKWREIHPLCARPPLWKHGHKLTSFFSRFYCYGHGRDLAHQNVMTFICACLSDKSFIFTLSQLFRDEGYCSPSSETGKKYSAVESFIRLFLKCNLNRSHFKDYWTMYRLLPSYWEKLKEPLR